MNIILILTDQHRYDIVGANGSTICRSPNIDSIAAGGVNFQNAYSVCAVCSPARASIYTGLLPHRHGITRNVMEDDPNPRLIPRSIPTIAERLTETGYESHFIGKWHAGERLPTQAGFTGMDLPGYGNCGKHIDYLHYLENNSLPHPETSTVGTGWAHELCLAGVSSGPVEASIPYYLTEKTNEYLEQRASSNKPFFLALNYWGPHAPYVPCEPYASMYNPKDIPPWGNFHDEFTGKPPIYRRYRDAFTGEGTPPRTWDECAQWAALYFGFATQIDDQIGRVLNALEETGLAGETAVVFSCDHGDLCGAHGGMHDKGGINSQATWHIPLCGMIPGGATGSSTQLPVGNMDIPKTILELAGLEEAPDLDGNSLAPILRGEPANNRPDHIVTEFFGHHYAYETRMVIMERYKYVFHPGATDEIYDLENDPWELNNRINDSSLADIRRGCRERLLDWAKRTGDDLCVPCGLFHERLGGKSAGYHTGSMKRLQNSPTRLLPNA